MADQDLNIKLSADIDNLKQQLNSAVDAMKAATDKMKSSSAGVQSAGKGAAEGIGGAFQSLQGVMGKFSGGIEHIGTAFAQLGLLLAGGKMFKEAVSDANKWAGESGKLSKQLGVTTQEASILKVGLHGLGIETDTYVGASNKMIAGAMKSGKGLKDLGVDIRDLKNGGLRPTTEVMAEVMTKLSGLEEGANRNAAGIKIFGKGWQEASSLIRLTSEKMAEAKKEAEELHLIVGPEGAKQARIYNEGMRKVGLIQESMMIQIGNALLPILIKLGQWFGEEGPALIQGTTAAIGGISTAFAFLKAVIETVVIGITAFIDNTMAGLSGLGGAFKAIIEGRYSDAVQIAKNAGKEIKANNEAAVEGIAQAWDKFGKRNDKVNIKDPGAPKADGKTTIDTDKDASKTALALLKSDLAERKFAYEKDALDHGNFIKWTSQDEASWIEKNKDNYGMALREKKEVTKMYYAAKGSAMEQDFNGEIAALKTSMEQFKYQKERQLEIAEKIAEKIALADGEKSPQAQTARRDALKIRQEIAERDKQSREEEVNRLRAHNIALIDLEEDQIKESLKLGQISAIESIKLLEDTEKRKTDIAIEALKERLFAEQMTVVERQKILSQIEALEDAHNRKTAQSKRELDDEIRKSDGWAGALKGLQDFSLSASNTFENFKSATTSVLQGVEGAFTKGITGLLSGQMSLRQAMKSIWMDISSSIISALAKMAAQYIVSAIAQKTLSAATIASMNSVTVAKVAQTSATVAANTTETTSNLATASSGFFKAHSWIPWVGAAIAIGFIAMMMSQMKATGRAVGGVVGKNGPELTMLGEKGLEVVAPQNDFRDWAKSFVLQGASLAGEIEASRSLSNDYGYKAGSYASSVANNSSSTSSSSVINYNYNFSGQPLMSKADIEDFVFRAYQGSQRRNG